MAKGGPTRRKEAFKAEMADYTLPKLHTDGKTLGLLK
jgi:hypothetical protein